MISVVSHDTPSPQDEANLSAEDLKEMAEEFTAGCRQLTMGELDKVPLGYVLKYHGGWANDDPRGHLLAVVHKIATHQIADSMGVQVDQIVFDGKGEVKPGSKRAAARHELWVRDDADFRSVGVKPTSSITGSQVDKVGKAI